MTFTPHHLAMILDESLYGCQWTALNVKTDTIDQRIDRAIAPVVLGKPVNTETLTRGAMEATPYCLEPLTHVLMCSYELQESFEAMQAGTIERDESSSWDIYCQIQALMYVTGGKTCDLLALVEHVNGSRDIARYIVKRDGPLIKRYLKAVKQMGDPKPTTREFLRPYILQYQPKTDGDQWVNADYMGDHLKRYRELQFIAFDIEQEQEEIKRALIVEMLELGCRNAKIGDTRVKWRRGSVRFHTKKFAQEHPLIYAEYKTNQIAPAFIIDREGSARNLSKDREIT